MSIETAAICVLVAWCFFWIIRDDQATRRANQHRATIARIVAEESTTGTPIHDQLAAERFTTAVEKWGRP